MKLLVPFFTISGLLAFAVGLAIRLFDTGHILRAGAEGWWRASMAAIGFGMLFALIEIRDSLKKQ